MTRATLHRNYQDYYLKKNPTPHAGIYLAPGGGESGGMLPASCRCALFGDMLGEPSILSRLLLFSARAGGTAFEIDARLFFLSPLARSVRARGTGAETLYVCFCRIRNRARLSLAISLISCVVEAPRGSTTSSQLVVFHTLPCTERTSFCARATSHDDRCLIHRHDFSCVLS